MIGPVQVVVVGFDRPRFSGEVVAEFTRLEEAGIVRLVDLLLVSRAEDGSFETMTDEEIPAHLGRLAAGVLGWAGEEDVPPSSEPEAGAVTSVARRCRTTARHGRSRTDRAQMGLTAA